MILAKLLYAGPAWSGFCSAADNSKLDRFLNKEPKKAQLTLTTRATQKDAKIAPIRRVSFHFTEFHFPKFQITNA